MVALVSCISTSTTLAQSAPPISESPGADSLTYDFRGSTLSEAVKRLVKDTGLNIGYDPRALAGKGATCVIERATTDAVLDCLLKPNGLKFQRTSSGVYVITAKVSGTPGVSGSSQSDNRHFTLSGFAKDALTGELFIGANIFEVNRRIGTATNAFGFYSLTLPADSVVLHVSYIGYESADLAFVLNGDVQLNIELEPVTLQSGPIEVVATRMDRIERRSRMSTMSISIQQVKSMPTVLGEVDLMKSLMLLPGVQSANEGSSGLYVRGGSPDQTLTLLDGARVYNGSHLFGLFSVFNGDAIKHVELVKGGFPARYGGRLSSVLDIGMKEGNNKDIAGEAAVGAVASRFMIEGPLMKNKSSFIVSGRRTYIDALMAPFLPDDEKVGIFFYDINAKVNHAFSDRDRLYLSLYRGKDRYSADSKDVGQASSVFMQWGNLTSTARWNHVLSNRLFSNVTGTYSKYQFDIGVKEEARFTPDDAFKLNYVSGIRDWGLKADLDYLPAPNHYVRVGLDGTYHTFRPGATVVRVSLDEDDDDGIGLDPAPPIDSFEYSAYVEDDFRISPKLKANLGLHASGFAVEGGHFRSLEPRVSIRYLLPHDVALKASYAKMKQYILLLTNSSVGLPTDLWLPVTEEVPPQISHQVAVGLARSFSDEYEVSLEGYYKWMDHLIEFKEGASFLGIDQDWQDKVEFGGGTSRGIEVFVQKRRGRTTGWLGYTLSWTDRQFDNLNLGRVFPYKFDHRHDFAAVVIHRVSSRIEVSANWVFSTGSAVTLPTTTYAGHPYVVTDCFDCTIDTFDERNNYRQAAHHRLDVAINYSPTRSGRQMLTAGVYNVYNRKNPFFVWLREEDGQLIQFSLLPILPYITYRRSF